MFKYRLGIFWLIGLMGLYQSSTEMFSQAKGDVKFLIDNENGYFEILVDDTLLIKRYRDSLTVGNHKAQVWSYGYEVKEIEFMVSADSSTSVYVKLDRSSAYLAYQESYDVYRMKFHKAVTIPVVVTGTMAFTAGVCMLKAYDLKKQITSDIKDYHLTPQSDEIATIKETIESNNRKYTAYRYGYYVTGGLTLAGIAGSIYTGLKFRNNAVEPVYSKNSPFLNKSSFYFSPGMFLFTYRIG